MSAYAYEGGELELFAGAAHWKGYVRSQIEPFLAGRVLEVGAGIGTTTRVLRSHAGVREWTCLEPDPRLADRIEATLADAGEPPCEIVVGTLADWDSPVFDTVVYMDVLEHIEADRDEIRHAFQRLAPGGRLLVLAPAHPWLFTPFDEAIGHYRRYTKESLASVAPTGLRLLRLRYLDAAGLLASAANRLLLRSAMPTAAQMGFWDRVLVPVSRRLDPILRYSVGKSVLAVWERAGDGPGDRSIAA